MLLSRSHNSPMPTGIVDFEHLIKELDGVL
jgi:hypothetical protein